MKPFLQFFFIMNPASLPPKSSLPQKQREPFAFEKASPTELAWLAGLFQAEGYFYVDKRVGVKTNTSDYTPPPVSPGIRIAMIEEDVMQYVATLVEQKVVLEARQTKSGNPVFRVTIAARQKVQALLHCIFPYIIGEKTRARVLRHFEICEEYDRWREQGGRRQHAQRAARASARKKQG